MKDIQKIKKTFIKNNDLHKSRKYFLFQKSEYDTLHFMDDENSELLVYDVLDENFLSDFDKLKNVILFLHINQC